MILEETAIKAASVKRGRRLCLCDAELRTQPVSEQDVLTAASGAFKFAVTTI